MPYPTDRTTIHLFEDQAREHPGRPAVRWARGCLTYGELDLLAGQWASALRELGLARGDFVPLVTGGGPALPMMMLASMKLGAVFVPVDDAWPPARLAESLRRLRPPVVVLTSPGDVPAEGLTVVRVDGAIPPPGPVEPVSRAVPTVDDMAYGFFTSGSTGAPKCALNRHLGLLNRFLTMTRRFGGQHDVVLQNSRHVFDSSLWQLLWPLTKGSEVVLPEREGILDLLLTVEEIAAYGVTATDFVPSVFNMLVELLTVDEGMRERLGSLRHLLIGGEEIDPAAVRAFRAMLPGVTLTNTFGPTEASIGSVFHEIRDEDDGAIPIGRPIDNTWAVVLNARGEPVERGTVGEIHLGGDCLGMGYLDDPERTAAAFPPNPFPEIPGPVLYRTGDLAWQRADGALMFAGRSDQQIKLNGVLIDLLEVESAVMEHPAVRQAKAVVHGEGDLKILVCCVVLDPAASGVTTETLARHCANTLTAQAVPRVFLPVRRIPLNPNGKTDRRALRGEVAALLSGERTARTSEDPGTLTGPQRRLASLWQEVLPHVDAEQLGPDADFRACGGTSLTLQRLAALVLRTVGVRVAPGALAAAGTLAEQAGLLDAPGGAWSPAADAQLHLDIQLASTLAAAPGPLPAHEPREVLLTGATGFLGAQVLTELLDRTDAVVHCLVRADGPSEARRRIAEALGDRDPRRVVALPGDLARPRLGLDAATWRSLADSVDSVLHVGAQVNLLLGYSWLREANVLGTAEVLRLATTGRPKRLHHVSTLAVLPRVPVGDPAGPAGGDAVREPAREEELPPVAPRHGYERSKWAAERILVDARARGVPSTVVRLGEVMAHSRTGRGNPVSTLELLLRGCRSLGLRVATDAVTDWTPVDQAAAAVVAALLTGRDNETFHVIRPGTVRVEALLDLLDERVPLRSVGYREFHAAVTRGGDRGEPGLQALQSLLTDPDAAGPDALSDLFHDGWATASYKLGAELAEACGLDWEPVRGRELDLCVGALTND
ncbi:MULTISPECIES: amino acid adenylation domain-containing protein [unclassified Streptomyces]|uniref:non-ribosomal peptide synthetase n=1 Tax=unclassified Streptomyces TaxID=2593676 RepID=UPI0035DC873F